MEHDDRYELAVARMIIIWRMQDDGLLEGETLQAIANLFDVHRSTILRDLRRIANARRRIPDLLAAIKPPPLTDEPRP